MNLLAYSFHLWLKKGRKQIWFFSTGKDLEFAGVSHHISVVSLSAICNGHEHL